MRSDAQQQAAYSRSKTVGRTSKWGREGEALMLDPIDGPGWCPDMGEMLRVLLLMGRRRRRESSQLAVFLSFSAPPAQFDQEKKGR